MPNFCKGCYEALVAPSSEKEKQAITLAKNHFHKFKELKTVCEQVLLKNEQLKKENKKIVGEDEKKISSLIVEHGGEIKEI